MGKLMNHEKKKKKKYEKNETWEKGEKPNFGSLRFFVDFTSTSS